MAGVLSLKTSGAILAETCESYPNGWSAATDDYGSGAVVSPGHSGSYGFQLADAASVLAGAYMRLYKSVDLKTGSTRIARIFRAAGTLVTFSYAQNPFTGATIPQPVNSAYYTTTITSTDGGGQYEYMIYDKGSLGFIILEFNWPVVGETTGHIYIDTYNSSGAGLETRTDCGPIPSGSHVYEVVWVSGKVTLYLDGSQIGSTSDASIPTPGTYPGTPGPQGGGYTIASWSYFGSIGAVWNASCTLGSQTLLDYDTTTGTGTVDNGFYDTGWVTVTPTGVQTVEMKLRLYSGGLSQYPAVIVTAIFDDLIIMADSQLTISGLLAGMKVELLDAGNVVHGSVTCPVTNQDVYITGISALINTAYGFSGYFKVYNVDGTTLIHTTSLAPVWGGDVWQWVPNQTMISTSTTTTQIYRAGSGLSPGSAVVTATLTDPSTGNPIVGLTLTLTAVLGTCSPTSGTTDAYGKVTTTYTPGSSGGLGGVCASYAGSSTYSASLGQQLIDIYYGQIVPDASKDFQVFLEGQELVVATGNYKLSADFLPQAFTLVSPQLNTPVGGWWYVAIYRRGTLEFSGRILTRDRVGGATPQLTLTGLDEKVMLQRRVANHMYLDDPKNIITDLLTRYPCGITAGSIALYGSSILLPATYENLYDALMQVANLTGWVFRLNANRTLDFASTFGTIKSITIASGGGEASADHKEDWSKIDTTIYVIGSAAAASLVGTSTDALATLGYGLIEEVFLEKSLTTQGTVDLRAQTLLATTKSFIETITLNWIDTLATGAYGPYDIVTVTDSDLNLSGTYVVNTIQRDLTDANKVSLALTNRPLTIADALQAVRAVVKDLAVS